MKCEEPNCEKCKAARQKLKELMKHRFDYLLDPNTPQSVIDEEWELLMRKQRNNRGKK